MSMLEYKLKGVISSMNEGVLILDKNLRIVTANAAAEKFLGILIPNVIGRDVGNFFTILQGNQIILDENNPLITTLITGRPVSIGLDDNLYFKTEKGKKFPVLLSANPLLEGGVTGILLIFKDVTEEKRIKETKDSFVLLISNQFRTILTSIHWYTKKLDSDEAGTLTEKQKSFLNKIYNNTIRLSESLNTLLAFTRIEDGRIKFEPDKLDLLDFTKDIIKELKALNKERKVKITVLAQEDIPEVHLDKLMLKQVIVNLLSNAIQYTPDRGNIEINIKNKSTEIIYSIKDNGIGIPEYQKERIFEKFFRAENALLHVPGGDGLGLFLIKSLIELWNGKIWFESKENKGATFYFSIPLAESKE